MIKKRRNRRKTTISNLFCIVFLRSYVQQQLTALCELLPFPLPKMPQEANAVFYASSDFERHPGPLLLLSPSGIGAVSGLENAVWNFFFHVFPCIFEFFHGFRRCLTRLLLCGSAPGGAAGVWGRSLCLNASLQSGAMFDYVLRAEALGWAVVVANPNANEAQGRPLTGSESPHRHLETLWTCYLQGCKAERMLLVAHSYGAAVAVHLLKAQPVARERLQAMAFTDGMALKGDLLQEAVEGQQLRRFRELAPLAFEPAAPEVRCCLEQLGRNFVASGQPLGTVLSTTGLVELSAGHESHPNTTHAATEAVFDFLQRGARGEAAAANAELR